MFRASIVALALAAGVLGLGGLSSRALAQRNIAFIAGTDKYDNLDPKAQLQRAVNDARAVAAAFKSLRFEVISVENVTRGQFNAQWQVFLDKLKAGDTAAFYYAGHGVEIEGLNFLLPRDIPNIKFGRQEQIKRESISVAELLLDLRSRNPAITLIILDACRENPLIPEELRSAVSMRGGLAALKGEPPKGTFIMYSAGAGESALDRLPGNDPDKVNSIFTRSLVPLMSKRGLPIHELARQLRTDVVALASTVSHVQRPAYYDGIDNTYCLAGCEGDDAAKSVGTMAPSVLGQAAAEWDTLRTKTDIAELEAFAVRHKGTYFDDLAKARIAELKKTETTIVKSVWVPQGPLTFEEERKLKPGDTFQECDNAYECPVMVVVPAGSFMMGAPAGEEGRFDNEGPPRKVTIGKPFAVGKFEVRFGEWDACVAEGGCKHTPGDEGWGRGKRPVINVSWDDVTKEFLPWLSRKTGKTYRLLTESEWEYAARAGTTTPFSTGSTITTEQANFKGDVTYGGSQKGVFRGKTVEVGTFPANGFGLHDMHGNVYEWVQDCHENSYAGAPTDGTAVTSGVCIYRVLRGGSWLSVPWGLRSAIRGSGRPDLGSYSSGFRVARSLSQ